MDAVVTFFLPVILIPCILTAITCCIFFHIIINRSYSTAVKDFFADTAKTFENKEIQNALDNMKSDILLQFDDFMLNRLTKEMPVLNMFIDDKLISELKTVFEKELTNILPQVIKKNISQNEILNSPGITALIQLIKKRIAAKMVYIYVLSIVLSCIIGFVCTLLSLNYIYVF